MSTHPSRYYTQDGLQTQPQAQTQAQQNTNLGNVGLPQPIQTLREEGHISSEEEALARRFFYEVYQSELLPQINSQHQHAQPQQQDPQMAQTDAQVKGIFALLNSVDEQLLGTICALLLELKLSGQGRPLPIEEVGRRIMGYSSQEANAAAGATLLRAALWIVRFGYQNPQLCQSLVQEKQTTIDHSNPPTGW